MLVYLYALLEKIQKLLYLINFMEHSNNLTVIKFKYFLKKFLLYFLYGATGAVFPFVFGIVLGIPSISLAAVALAIADLINLEVGEDKKPPIVFSKAHTTILYVLIALVISYTTIILSLVITN
ncbi:hypothetical protein Megvenef_01414 [Candidatus Megaera venefica]|uniref:Uncharacterized protein n=1 Tax=Candidatus Megaera venefica TaxID=2055910 RepID=A0ABU5NE61_9RICK|nr:hypothetical protein [Candidatus Megaera venefica]MEA0971436.1 hypothetical protein [Candidatus Megaera venefica]